MSATNGVTRRTASAPTPAIHKEGKYNLVSISNGGKHEQYLVAGGRIQGRVSPAPSSGQHVFLEQGGRLVLHKLLPLSEDEESRLAKAYNHEKHPSFGARLFDPLVIFTYKQLNETPAFC